MTADAAKNEEQNQSMLDVEKVTGAGDKAKEGEGEADKSKVVDLAEVQKNKDVTAEPGKKADRPEWLTEDKFWDAEKGEVKTDLVFKNLQELQKQFSRGDHKAPAKPEEYKINLKDEQKEVLFGKKDADVHADEGIKALTSWGVKHKVSQAALDEVLGMYADMTGEALDDSPAKIDLAAEKAKLGKNADSLIAENMGFFTQLFKSGEINQTELREAQILFETAAGISLFQKIRAHYGEKEIPTDLKAADGDMPSRDELAKMRMEPKYDTDADYRKKVDAMYDRMYGTAPAMSSR
jgi:hypothetical protein